MSAFGCGCFAVVKYRLKKTGAENKIQCYYDFLLASQFSPFVCVCLSMFHIYAWFNALTLSYFIFFMWFSSQISVFNAIASVFGWPLFEHRVFFSVFYENCLLELFVLFFNNIVCGYICCELFRFHVVFLLFLTWLVCHENVWRKKMPTIRAKKLRKLLMTFYLCP